MLCVVMMGSALVSCSKPPELAEVLPRLKELIEASYGVNDLLFGDGPDTYPRIYEEDVKPYYGEDGKTFLGHYRYIEDDELGTILAYNTRTSGGKYTYLLVTAQENTTEDCVYVDEAKGLFYVKIDYTEEEYDFYYTDTIPSDYDVVIMDESNPYQSIQSIKSYAETVYSRDYLQAIYSPIFDGAMVSDQSESGYIKARYSEYTDSEGKKWFMFSNTYEPIATEKRIYDIDSAQMAKGSNGEYVRIEIDSYLESKPEERLTVTLALILQDGVWMLDTPTY